MESVTAKDLRQFFERLGESLSSPADFYLLDGSALSLLGSTRETVDVDYSIKNASPETETILRELVI